MSLTEWHERLKKPAKRKSKYNAKRTLIDGKHFPSQLEAAVYLHLSNLVKIGAKSELRLQHTVRMESAGISWKIDFSMLDEYGALEFVEAKGFECGEYVLKKKLYRAGFFGVAPLTIYKGTALKLYVAEIITPKQLR